MKKRIKWYILFIIIAIIVNNFAYIKEVTSNVFVPKELYIYTDDTILSRVLNKNKTIDGYKLSYRTNNADIIITANELEDSSYKKLNTKLYSPIIMVSNDVPSSYDIHSVDDDYYALDYKIVLKGLKDDMTFLQVGLDKFSRIKLTIPSEKSPYYNTVISEMYYSLYGTTEIKNENLKEFKTILEKCEKVDNIYNTLNARKNESSDEGMYLFPEYIINTDSFTQYYEDVHYAYEYNIYIKNNIEDSNAIENLFKTKKFYRAYQLRSTNADYEVDIRDMRNDIIIKNDEIKIDLNAYMEENITKTDIINSPLKPTAPSEIKNQNTNKTTNPNTWKDVTNQTVKEQLDNFVGENVEVKENAVDENGDVVEAEVVEDEAAETEEITDKEQISDDTETTEEVVEEEMVEDTETAETAETDDGSETICFVFTIFLFVGLACALMCAIFEI